MNNLRVNGRYYIPFWALTKWVDVVPEMAFEPITLVGIASNEDGQPLAIIRLDNGQTINGVPQAYVITTQELQEWATRIGEWIVSSAKHFLAE